MKKIIFMSLIICLMSAGVAYARNDRAADVTITAQDDAQCFIAASEPANFCGVDLYSTHMANVSTSGGMTQLTCHFTLPEYCVPTELVTLRGLPCPVYTKQCGVINTVDSLIIITPSGKATVFCQFNYNDDCTP